MTEADIASVVSQAIKHRFPAASQNGVDVRIVEDFDGEYILHVTVHYTTRPAARPEMISTLHDIRDALIAEGEERFVLLTNVIADERRAVAEVE